MSATLVQAVNRYEEERGKPRPSFNHGAVQANLIADLARQERYRAVSELTLELGGHPYTPDVSVYLREPLDLRCDHVRMADPPVVAVEILSPTQGYQEVMDKVRIYLENGVRSCWVVNPPQQAVTIYLADGSQKTYVDGQVTDPATGIGIELDRLFA